MTSTRDRKSKFTASVNERIVAKVDEQAYRLKVSRSDIVQEAMEMWLQKQSELEDEEYFRNNAAEMNADAKEWNALSSQSIVKRKAKS